MDDYIKREDAIMTAMNYEGSGNAQDASQDIAAELASIPAADVRENVRGEWKQVESQPKWARCSVCNNISVVHGIDRTGHANIHKAIYQFCPKCGADMRGAKDD